MSAMLKKAPAGMTAMRIHLGLGVFLVDKQTYGYLDRTKLVKVVGFGLGLFRFATYSDIMLPARDISVSDPDARAPSSRLREHERFRKQCARRIPGSLLLFALAVGGCSYLTYSDRTFAWYAVGIIFSSGFYTFMEIFGYYRHEQKIRELSGGKQT